VGGDTFFYYTGSYSFSRGKRRGEMIVNQHTEAPGLNLVFGRREVTCGFICRRRRHRAARQLQHSVSGAVDAQSLA
jgi:hypothetical protein